MLYRFLRAVILVYYKIIFRIKVIGAENIPKSGGVIISGNHRSNHDPVILAVSQKRPLAFMAKESLLKVFILGPILRKIGVFPVKRGSGDIGAVKKAIEVLKEGNMLSLFPEGTRNKTNDILAPFQSGAALIAHKSESVIVPVAIIANFKLFSKVTVIYHKPVNIKAYGEKPDIKLITNDLKEIILKTMGEYGWK